jgi:uncharacterized membrane protein YkoI
MKTIFLLGIIGFTVGCSNAQKSTESKTPEAVTTAFAKKYPSVKKVAWEDEGKTYEAEFTMNKIEYSAVFDASGNFLEEEAEIKVTELPASVTNYCKKNYADHKLSEAAKIIDANGKLMYEAEMKKGKVHFDALFDANGNIISKEDESTED